MNLELTIAGDVQINRRLLRLGRNAENAGPAFDDIIDRLIMPGERKQFETEGGYRSQGWAPLLPSTIAAKKQGTKILEETGDLMRSLTQRGASHQVRTVESSWFAFGTDLPYAGHHQTGTGDLRGKDRRSSENEHGIPRRRILELDEADRRNAVKRLQSWLITGELLP